MFDFNGQQARANYMRQATEADYMRQATEAAFEFKVKGKDYWRELHCRWRKGELRQDNGKILHSGLWHKVMSVDIKRIASAVNDRPMTYRLSVNAYGT